MLMDGKATRERHAGAADLVGFLEIGRARFGLSDQLVEVLTNTAKELGWMP
jgi:hypothetical protein